MEPLSRTNLRYRTSARNALAVIAAAVVAVACTVGDGPSTESGPSPSPAPTQPPPRPQINWVNFVQFGETTYLTDIVDRETPLEESDLGPEFDRVVFSYDGNVFDPFYRSKDGDASRLEAGSPVFTVKGYAPEFMLAARYNGRLELYVADTNPNAKRGSDLLDIEGKVESIEIKDVSELRLGQVDDPTGVDALVDMVLNAPVDQEARADPDSQRRIVDFRLKDGTTLLRHYFLEYGLLQRGILLPDEFRSAIETVIR